MCANGQELEPASLRPLSSGSPRLLERSAAVACAGDSGTPQACPADFDGDCSVGILDLLILLGNWEYAPVAPLTESKHTECRLTGLVQMPLSAWAGNTRRAWGTRGALREQVGGVR